MTPYEVEIEYIYACGDTLIEWRVRPVGSTHWPKVGTTWTMWGARRRAARAVRRLRSGKVETVQVNPIRYTIE